MPLLTGLTADGTEVPVQVEPDGVLVAEGIPGPAGPQGPQGPAGPAGPPGPQGPASSGTASMAGFWARQPWISRQSAADNSWLSVCWSAEASLFVAVAASGSGDRVMTSPDGINWTSRQSAADNSWVSVCWSAEAGLFVAVAYSGSGNRVMTSP